MIWQIKHPFVKLPAPKVVQVALVPIEQPKPAPPTPTPPKPTPPKPDPPKPPEPPKPDPPKPDPPKPPEPKKTDPPKPPEPKKTETKKNEQKKPDPPKTREQSIKDRFNKATVKETKQPKTPTQPSTDIKKRIKEVVDTPTSSTSPSNARIAQEQVDYANQIVRPYVYDHWNQPSQGELDVRQPQPAVISFTVFANGTVTAKRIETPSNSKAINRSVQQFLDNLTSLPPLSKIGSKASSLQIRVNVGLQ